MAPVIADSTTSTSQSTRPSAPPSNLRMPHVFVIPPEEEQQENPPWCCFDADEQPENNDDIDVPSAPDIHFFDVPYLFQPLENDVLIPVPIIRRASVHHPRPRAPTSKKLEKKQRPEAVQIIENKPFQARQRDAREDSDIIEVVKVKRGRENPTDLENTKAKRTKTLKARATRALRSIKNVGKASHRAHVKELWTSNEGMPGIFKGVQEQIRSQQDKTEYQSASAPPKKGSLSRGSLRSLSQIFQPAKPSRIDSLFTVCVPPSAATVETHPPANPSSLPHPRYNNTNSSFNEAPNTLTTDDTPNRPVFPIHSTKKTANTKISVRELHRLFSFSSSSPDGPTSSPAATVAPFSSASGSSKPSISTSTLSQDYPDVPLEEDMYVEVDFFDLESNDQKPASRHHQTFHTCSDDDLSTPRRLSDLSLEMKLDSLHFDALSFDPEDYRVSREESILR